MIEFTPLAQGMLTGRYLDGHRPTRAPPATGRSTVACSPTRRSSASGARRDRRAARADARALALAWALRDERVTSLVIGASRVPQLEENVAALDRLEFGDDELAEIDRHAVGAGSTCGPDPRRGGGLPGPATLNATPRLAGTSRSAQVRQHLRGDELEVVEVAQVDELEVDPVGAEVAQAQQLLDRGIRGAGDVDLGERVGVGVDRREPPEVVASSVATTVGRATVVRSVAGVAADLLARAPHAVERLGDRRPPTEADVELGREPRGERRRAPRAARRR